MHPAGTTKNPLATQPIGKLLLKFALPSVVSMVVNSLYNIVDQIFIGQGVGYLGNAATNVAFPFVTLSLALALLVADGNAANFSLKLGAGDKTGAQKSLGNAIVLMLISGCLLLAIGLTCLKPLMLLFGATETVLPYALDYAGITMLGMPFVLVGVGLNSCIRADGSPRLAMISMLVGAVINTILDPLFIFVFEMGVKGAAWATVLGQIATCVISVTHIRHLKNVKLTYADLRLNARVVIDICKLGLSSLITQLSVCVLQIVVNNSLRYYGALSPYGADIPLSALGIVMKVQQILFALVLGISVGSQPIIGFNYGARSYRRVRQTYLTATGVATGCAIIGWIVFQTIPDSIVSVFGQESDLYNAFAVQCFRQFLFMCFGMGFQVCTGVYFQATGRSMRSAILSLSRQLLFLVPLVLILPAFRGLDGILAAGPYADALAISLAVVFILLEMRGLARKIRQTEAGLSEPAI